MYFDFVDVGTAGDVFTLEVHHGGFFVGSGNLKSYVHEKIDWFDGIETDTWSPLSFGDFAQQLGYMENTSLRIYSLFGRPYRIVDYLLLASLV